MRDVTTVVEANRAERKAHAERLAQDEALRATLLDLSHDLKTPLASLKLGLGRLHAEPQNPQVARALRAEAHHLDALCSNFVSLIRYTAAPPERNLVELDINDVVERVVTRLSITPQTRGSASPMPPVRTIAKSLSVMRLPLSRPSVMSCTTRSNLQRRM